MPADQLQVDEVLERLGPRAAASHETAARLWGIELLHPGPDRVTVPQQRSRVRLPGWQVRRLDLPSCDLVVVEARRRTTPLRTVLDLAQVLPLPDALVAADSALRQELVGLPAVTTVLGRRVGRGARGPRTVARLVDPASGSVLETLLRLLLQDVLPSPRSQYEVRDRSGDLVARVDLCWPERRLVVEADGFAFHSDRRAYRRDRERLNELERLGWRVLRFTWEDVVHRPDHVAALVRDCCAAAA